MDAVPPAKPLKGLGIIKITVLLLISISLFALSPYAFVFLLLGMLPAIVSTWIDKRANKCASNTVSIFNFIGIMPFVVELWRASNTGDMAQHMITDISVWFFIYSAAAFGWIMIWGMPQLGATVFLSRAETKIQRLHTMQKELIEEWGEEVTKGL